MKRQQKIAAVLTAVLIVIGAGAGYAAYDYFAGNHVEIEDVISSPTPTGSGEEAAVAGAADVDGTWSIQSASQVYFSVTTSKETVNFSVNEVAGSWQIDTADPAKSTAEGTVELSALNSGNTQRDNHIKADDYLQVGQHPQATFTVNSFEGLPAEWKDGEAFDFKMTGTLTVKGIDKEVTFDSKAQYAQDQINLEGSTVVTFDDFGMKNPHNVVLDTENDVTVQLRLILAKS